MEGARCTDKAVDQISGFLAAAGLILLISVKRSITSWQCSHPTGNDGLS